MTVPWGFRLAFSARGLGYSVSLSSDDVRVSFQGSLTALEFLNTNPHPAMEGLDVLPGRSSFFIGRNPSKWQAGVPQYSRVRYRNIYPGIDLVFYGAEGRLEYDFVLAPGANPNAIQMSLSGPGRGHVSSARDLRS